VIASLLSPGAERPMTGEVDTLCALAGEAHVSASAKQLAKELLLSIGVDEAPSP
jgi:hypothetical protein